MLESPRGAGGFGYDPLFFLPTFGRTVAELDRDDQERVSHRAEAARAMLVLMRDVWGLRHPSTRSASGR